MPSPPLQTSSDSLWTRARNRVRAILGWIPLTWRSLLGAGLLAWVYVTYGLERSDLILRMVGLGGLILIAVSMTAVLVVALVMRLRKPAPPKDPWVFQTGGPFVTGYHLTLGAWLPLIQIELSWESPVGLEARLVPWRGRLREEVVARRRTQAEGFVRQLSFTDAFGLARVTWRRPVAQAMKVLPACGRLEPRQLLQQLATGDLISHPSGEPDGDLIETRRYSHGDPLKRILWKSYARTRQLLVRMPERAIAPRQKTLAYLVADQSDEPAAGTARTALEMGVFGQDFVFRADGSKVSTNVVPDAVEQIVQSAQVTEQGGMGLPQFLNEERGNRQACVVFAPAEPGPWLSRVEEQVRQRKGAISVVVGVDGVQIGGRASLLRRFLFAEEEPWRDRVTALQEVCERLARVGAPVTILDRLTGLPVSSNHLQLLKKRSLVGSPRRLTGFLREGS